jgi:hypothetical protein
MRRRPVIGGVAASLLAVACTTMAPPWPPLFLEFVGEAPAVYHPKRAAWAPGRVLVYNTVDYLETIVEREVPVKKRTTAIWGFRAREETAQGRRVDVSLNGKRYGAVSVSTDGQLTEVTAPTVAEETALRDALRSISRLAGGATATAYFSMSLVPGQQHELRIPAKDLLSGDALHAVEQGILRDEWPIKIELVTFRIVAGRQAAEIYSTFPNMISKASSLRLPSTMIATFTSLRGSGRSYEDLATGLTIADYADVELSGYVNGKAFRQRRVSLSQLDAVQSHF